MDCPSPVVHKLILNVPCPGIVDRNVGRAIVVVVGRYRDALAVAISMFDLFKDFASLKLG
jgi:hypothetical protein